MIVARKIGLGNLVQTADDSFTNIENLVTCADIALRCVSFLAERGYTVELIDDGETLAVQCDELAFEEIHTALMCVCASVAFQLEAELHLIKARARAAV